MAAGKSQRSLDPSRTIEAKRRRTMPLRFRKTKNSESLWSHVSLRFMLFWWFLFYSKALHKIVIATLIIYDERFNGRLLNELVKVQTTPAEFVINKPTKFWIRPFLNVIVPHAIFLEEHFNQPVIGAFQSHQEFCDFQVLMANNTVGSGSRGKRNLTSSKFPDTTA